MLSLTPTESSTLCRITMFHKVILKRGSVEEELSKLGEDAQSVGRILLGVEPSLYSEDVQITAARFIGWKEANFRVVARRKGLRRR